MLTLDAIHISKKLQQEFQTVIQELWLMLEDD